MTAATDLPELQKGQLKVASSFGFCFFGGGLLDFLPILYNKAKEGAPGSLQVCPQLSAVSVRGLSTFKTADHQSLT